jgi:hypothetical protein
MKTYTVLYAEDTPFYGFKDIEAADDADVIVQAKLADYPDCANDPDWHGTVCRRIVGIHDDQNNDVACDIPLDDFYLRRGGDADRLLCAAARDLFLALTRARAELEFQQKHFPRADDTELREVLHAVNAALAKAEGAVP